MRVNKDKTCACGGASCDLSKNQCYNATANKYGASSGSVCILQVALDGTEENEWKPDGEYNKIINGEMKICPGAGICDQGNYCVIAPVLSSRVPDCGDAQDVTNGPCKECGDVVGIDCLKQHICKKGNCTETKCKNNGVGPCTACGKQNCSYAQLCDESRGVCVGIMN